MTEPKKRLVTKVKFAVVGVVVGLALGIGGTLFIQNHNPEDEQSLTTSVVFERIVSQNEMVSASQSYSIVDKATDANTFFDIVKIPFTDNSFWYRYVGTIKAGVNLEDATYHQDGTTIYVTLPDPYIISNTPNMNESGVLEENNNIFNPIHVEDVDRFQAQCFQKSEDEVVAGGLLEEARSNAQNNVRNMFVAAFGDGYTVEFE